MWIKIASRERKLQSPEGSFVLFEKFVFVKTQAVRGLKEHESNLMRMGIIPQASHPIKIHLSSDDNSTALTANYGAKKTLLKKTHKKFAY